MTYERQLSVKALVIEDAFARIGRLIPPASVRVIGSPETGYRMRARLHVRDGRAGFFREGTHEVCDPRQTGQLRDDSCDTLEQLGAALRSLGMKDVRGIELSENLDASQRVVHLDAASRLPAAVLKRLGASPGLTGLTVSNDGDRRPRVEVVNGDPQVEDRLEIDGRELQLRRHVLAFFQANRYLLPTLVRHVAGHLPLKTAVVDLYAGTGLFSLAAAVLREARVTAVEGDSAGASDLIRNAESASGRITAVHAAVELFLANGRHPRTDVVIVDPPRTGMSTDALAGVLSLQPQRIVYVSCDVATLARDARKIAAAGYTLVDVTGFDLFPNTPHVESVVLFER
jgi:23S rRNA (uracil1939-C5)-methyltransferase